jgi:peptidoglycan/xylan/chitin deacetylase (PgdA/CDA1 family)
MTINKFKLWLSSRYDFPRQSPAAVSLSSLPKDPTFMYHSIGEDLFNGSSIADVAAHVEILEQTWRLKGSDSRECVTFTFDDGYRSSLPAIGMLLKMGYRVIVFYPLCDPAFSYLPKDCLRIVLDRLPVGSMLHIGGMRFTLRCTERHSRRMLAMRINRFLMMKHPLPDYLSIYHEFQYIYRSLLDVPCKEHVLMTVDELDPILCRTNLLELGAHGRGHYRFDRLRNTLEMEEEILTPQHELERVFDVKVESLAYPYGLYSPEVETYAMKHYRRVFTVSEQGGINGNGSQPRIGLDGVALVAGA